MAGSSQSSPVNDSTVDDSDLMYLDTETGSTRQFEGLSYASCVSASKNVAVSGRYTLRGGLKVVAFQ